MHLQNLTVAELKEQPYETQKRFADTAGDEVQKFLDFKYPNCNYDIRSTLYETLLEEDYDHGDKLWNIKDNSLNLLELMSNNEVASIMKPSDINHCVKMLRTLVDFADRLQQEKAQAELHAVYIKHWGTERIDFTASIKNDYTKKLKLAQYEKELERA